MRRDQLKTSMSHHVVAVALAATVVLPSACLAQVSAQERRAAKAAATRTFLDASAPKAERLQAVARLGYPEDETITKMLAVGANRQEDDEIRAAALEHTPWSEEWVRTVLPILDDVKNGNETLNALLVKLVSKRTFRLRDAQLRQSYTRTLRGRLDDQRATVRERAYLALVPTQDPVAITKLVEGLQDGGGKSPVKLQLAIELLDVAGATNHMKTIRPYLKHEDTDVRAEAARVLAADAQSRPAIVELVKSKETPGKVRTHALRGLARFDEAFPNYSIPLIQSSDEPIAIREAAMSAMTARLNFKKVAAPDQIRFAEAVEAMTKETSLLEIEGGAPRKRAIDLLQYLKKRSTVIRRHFEKKRRGNEPSADAAEWRRLVGRLPRLQQDERALALGRLRDLAQRLRDVESPDLSAAPLSAIWTSAVGSTDDEVLAGVLDIFRALGPAARDAAPELARCLPHAADVYQDRDRWEVVRLRAYLLVTLGEIGLPETAFRHLLDAIANANDRDFSLEVAGAVRAARPTGDRGQVLVPFLLRLIPRLTSEIEISLERYRVDFPPEEATTLQLEAVRTLGELCRPQDEAAVALLRRVASSARGSRWDPRSIRDAKAALDAIAKRGDLPQGKTASSCCADAKASTLTATPTIPQKERTRLADLEIAFEDQDGRQGKLDDLIDRPTLLTFFYARCENQLKCSAAVVWLARLQRRLESLGLDRDIRLLAVTHEPTFDEPRRLRSFGLQRGLRFGANARALRLDPERHEAFVKALDAPVSFNAGVVNTHGVALHLLDGKGRLARRYHTVLWDNERVIADVRKLLAEGPRGPRSSSARHPGRGSPAPTGSRPGTIAR